MALTPRVAKEATALSDVGHDVHVIHGQYSKLASKFDKDVKGNFTTHQLAYGSKVAPRTKYIRQTLTRHIAKFLCRYRTLLPRFAHLAIAPISSDLIKEATKVQADLYIAHYTPALPAAALAAEENHAIFAFDAEDYHPGDLSNDACNDLQNSMISAIEARHLRQTTYITAASPGIAEAYTKKYHLPHPSVILNTFPKSIAPESYTVAGDKPNSPSLYWFSQTIGPNRGLECAVQAISIAKSRPHLYLRGTPTKNYSEKLHRLALQHGVEHRLHIEAPRPPGELVLLASRYDLGFVGETGHTPNRKIALTNKQFTYLLAGVPAVMSDIPAHVTFSSEAPGATWLYKTDNPTDLAKILDLLLTDKNALETARRNAFALGRSKFNWELERMKLINLVRDLVVGETQPERNIE